jgi:hypothetical protein
MIVALLIAYSTIAVALPIPIGQLTSNSPCILQPGETRCTVTISVHKENTPISCLWKTTPTLGLVSCFSQADWEKNWQWTNVNGHTMQLRAHSSYPTHDPNWPSSMATIYNNAPLLDEIIVWAEQPPPPPPNIVSGVLTCSDFYCIKIKGLHFQQNSYVDVRLTPNGTIYASYRGNSITRSSDGTYDYLTFRIINSVQRNFLNSTGLYFYVVNPGAGWAGPLHLTRDASSLPSGSLTTNSPCILLPGESYCDINITVNQSNTPVACIWKTTPSVGLVSCGGSSQWSTTWNWGKLSGHTMKLMAHNSYPANGSMTEYNQGVELDSAFVKAIPAPPAKGGSVFNWYDHDDSPITPSYPKDKHSRIMPYGIIKNYDDPTVRNIVKSELQFMHDEGQRKLHIDFWHGRGLQWKNHGTYVWSRARVNPKSGQIYFLDDRIKTNFSNFLSDIKSTGFEFVYISLQPSGCNSWKTWKGWYLNCKMDLDNTFNGIALIENDYNINDPNFWRKIPLWKENWEVLKAITSLTASSGLDYLIDLNGEGLPVYDMEDHQDCDNGDQCMPLYPEAWNIYQERTEAFQRDRWQRYVATFGKSHTVGFSLIASNPWQATHRTATMASIYAGNYPVFLSASVYSPPDPDKPIDPATIFPPEENIRQTFNILKGKPGGYNFIIREAWYNNSESAQILNTAINQSGIRLLYLFQWPISLTEGYAFKPPLSYINYYAQGF